MPSETDILKKEIELERKIEKAECEASYYEFFKSAWAILEPQTTFKDNWHVKYLCDVLQAEAERIAAKKPKTKDISITISPRSAKSHIVTIVWNPWVWTRFPHLRFINSSYSKDLSIEHCVLSRRVIESEWYQENWGGVFKMASDQNVKSYFENDKRGTRIAASVPGGISGKGADIIIGDDLIDARDDENEGEIQKANEHYFNQLYSRLNDQNVGVRVLVQQRLNQKDTAGVIDAERKDEYFQICIPLEEKDWINPPELRAFYRDGLFFPSRFDQRFVEAVKRMGSRKYNAQYLQRPSPVGGNIYQADWFQYWTTLPSRFDEMCQSWDFTFKGNAKSDFVVGQVWGRAGANCYLIDQVRGQWDFVKSLQMILTVTEKYPNVTMKLIEDKANGPGIISVLKNKISGILPVDPEGSKAARAHSVTPLYEAKNVFVPDPKQFPWVQDFIDEHLAFTGKDTGKDDQVDAASQALAKIGLKSSLSNLKRLLEEFE